jgi:hypothetical protein
MAEAANFDTTIDAIGNITTKRADDFDLQTNFLHDDDQSPHDLTQYDTLVANIKETAKGSEYVMQFSIGDGFTVASNLLTWHKDAADMMLESKGYVYDIEATITIGNIVSTIASGTFTVLPDVTRSGDTPAP